MNLWIGRQVIIELENGSVAKGILVLDRYSERYAISVGSGMKWPLSPESYPRVQLA